MQGLTPWLLSLAGPIITLFWPKLCRKWSRRVAPPRQIGFEWPLAIPAFPRRQRSCRFLPSMRMIVAAVALFLANHLMARPPEGIPRELARERAGISDLRYHLRFTLTPHASAAWSRSAA